MATTIDTPASEISGTTTSSKAQSVSVATEPAADEVILGDSRHIFTAAARSLNDCAELLRFLKAAIAEEENRSEKENEEQNVADALTHNTSGNNSLNDDSASGQQNGQGITHGSKHGCSDSYTDRSGPRHISRDQSTNLTAETTSNFAFTPTATGFKMVPPCKRSEIYTKPSALACQGTVGKHVRHLHDHFRLLLSAYPPSKGLSLDDEWRVDYDQRSREVPMETDIDLAIRELEHIKSLLEKTQATPQESTPSGLSQAVTLHATIDPSYPSVSFQSTFGRELWFCSLHAVHHFAMIKVICSEFGLPVSDGFGLAPSTVKSRQ